MATPKGDFITPVPETKPQEIDTDKQKLSVPRRIMEEEVWFSGSELKTDNSSSDEEHAQHARDLEDRIKKGARKKTKYVSQTSRCKISSILREQQQQQQQTCESIKKITIQEVTATGSSSMSSGNCEVIVVDTSKEVEWRPKRGSITLPGLSLQLDKEQNPQEANESLTVLSTMLKNCENIPKKFLQISGNTPDDEKTQLQKIKILEERIAKAEKIYMDARQETDRLVGQMEEMIFNIAAAEGPDKNFFMNLTKKWNDCLSKRNSKTDISEGCTDESDEEGQNIEKNQLIKSKLVSMKNKYKKRKIIKIRKGSNYNIVLKNIKQCSKTRFIQDLKPSNFSEFEDTRLKFLLNSPEEVFETNEDYIGYRLRASELKRFSDLSNQLTVSQKSGSGDFSREQYSNGMRNLRYQMAGDCLEELRISDEDGSNDESASNRKYYQYFPLTDAEKQKLASSHTNISLTDSLADYESCEEIKSECPSSTNFL